MFSSLSFRKKKNIAQRKQLSNGCYTDWTALSLFRITFAMQKCLKWCTKRNYFMKKQFLNSLKFKKFGERSFHHHLDPFLVRLSRQPLPRRPQGPASQQRRPQPGALPQKRPERQHWRRRRRTGEKPSPVTGRFSSWRPFQQPRGSRPRIRDLGSGPKPILDPPSKSRPSGPRDPSRDSRARTITVSVAISGRISVNYPPRETRDGRRATEVPCEALVRVGAPRTPPRVDRPSPLAPLRLY